jgi:hypothetical protein
MKWCETCGFGPFVLTGMSMGGHVSKYFSCKKMS